MAGASLTLELQGMKELQTILRRMERANMNFRAPLKLAGLFMMRSFYENFRNQGIPEIGIRWKKLSPWALSNRTRRKGRRTTGSGGRLRSDQILQDTGRLRMSLTRERSTGQLYRMTDVELRLGTKVTYAGTHQFGKPGTQRVKAKVGWFKRAKPGRKRKTVLVRPHLRVMVQPPVPARPFMAIKPTDAYMIGRIFMNYENNVMMDRLDRLAGLGGPS